MKDDASILKPELTLDSLLQNATGRGVRVAVIDSGIDAGHPALRGKVVRACIVHDEGNGQVQCEEIPPEEGVDSFGHGTAVAGIIADIAPEVELISVKVLGPDNTGSGEALLAGLGWALDQRIKLINMSLATSKQRFLLPLFKLCEQAYVQDAILVVSKRNWGDLGMPAEFSSVVSVDLEGSEDKHYLRFYARRLIEFAARGHDVEVLAPGGGSALRTGTSFATPHITGICALLLSRFPDLLPYEMKAILASWGRQQRPGARGVAE